MDDQMLDAQSSVLEWHEGGNLQITGLKVTRTKADLSKIYLPPRADSDLGPNQKGKTILIVSNGTIVLGIWRIPGLVSVVPVIEGKTPFAVAFR
jgi:malic enzyme